MAIEIATPRQQLLIPRESIDDWGEMELLLLQGLFKIMRVRPDTHLSIMRGASEIDLFVTEDGRGILDIVDKTADGEEVSTLELPEDDHFLTLSYPYHEGQVILGNITYHIEEAA